MALVVPGFGRAPGSAGFAPCASVGQTPFSGIVAAPSTASTSAPPPDTARCNSAGPLAADENTVHTPSADSAPVAAAVPRTSAGQPPAFYAGVADSSAG